MTTVEFWPIALFGLVGVLVLGALIPSMLGSRRRPAPGHRHPASGMPQATSTGKLMVPVSVGSLVVSVLLIVGYLGLSWREEKKSAFIDLERRTRSQAPQTHELARAASEHVLRSPRSTDRHSATKAPALFDEPRTETLTPPPETVIITPAPDTHAPDFTFQYHVPDAFEQWKRTFKGEYDAWAAVAPAEGVPTWVLDAGDSSYARHDIAGKISIWSRFPDAGDAIVGYSVLEPTMEDARAAAVRSAVDQLRAVLLWEIRDKRPASGNVLDFSAATELASHIIYERLDDLTTEEHTDLAALDVGQLFRAAVRIRADEPTLHALVQRLSTGLETDELDRIASRKKLLTEVFSSLGLALCIFLIYCVLNAGTKGHFAWPLRILSVGALAVILAAALLA